MYTQLERCSLITLHKIAAPLPLSGTFACFSICGTIYLLKFGSIHRLLRPLECKFPEGQDLFQVCHYISSRNGYD